MSKISVLFKPTKSKISSDLTFLWYYEYSYKDIFNVNKKLLKTSKRIKIDWVKYDDLWDFYDWCKTNFWKESIVVIICSISELFDFNF